MIAELAIAATIATAPILPYGTPGNYVSIPTDNVSISYTQTLMDNGWDEVTPDDGGVVVPREVAMQLCHTPNDCAYATGLITR